MKRKVRRRQSWDDRLFTGLCNLFLILFIIVVFYPIYFVVLASFTDPVYVSSGKPLLYPVSVNWNGYKAVFNDARIWRGYMNTLIYAGLGTLLGTVTVLMAGYALSRKDLPGRGWVMKAFVFTMYFSGGLIPTYLVVNGLGLVNTRLVLIIMGSVSAYNIVVVRSFMMSTIPDELLDAARIDGCGNGRFFGQIVLPLSKAVIAVMVLYIAVYHWNSYFNAMIYLTDDSKNPLQMVLRGILLTATAAANNLNENIDSAAMREMSLTVQLIKYSTIVVSTAPIICLYPFVQKYFMKGVMIGSVKG